MSIRTWPHHYQCHWCRIAEGATQHAAIRVFAGIMGGGWPACTKHANAAISIALRSMLEPNAHADYHVSAYAVHTDEGGYPFMRRPMWTARKRLVA